VCRVKVKKEISKAYTKNLFTTTIYLYLLRGCVRKFRRFRNRFLLYVAWKGCFWVGPYPNVPWKLNCKWCKSHKRTSWYGMSPWSYDFICTVMYSRHFSKNNLNFFYRCFRAEASQVQEEKGLYRVHQFTKVLPV
jgi:hypothetical protein